MTLPFSLYGRIPYPPFSHVIARSEATWQSVSFSAIPGKKEGADESAPVFPISLGAIISCFF